MQNVPKIVRERLHAAAPAVVRSGALSEAHPDADQLTAFAERSLSEFERTAVLDHLAGCGDCREVVALALPASEEMSGPVARGVRTSPRGWLTWPALRWGFVAAGVVAVASVGILRYQRQQAAIALRQSARLEVAANEPKKQDLDRFVAPEPKANEKLQAPAPAFADSLSASNSALDAKKSAPQPESSAALVQVPQTRSGTNSYRGGTFAANTLPHGPRLANQSQQQNAVQNNAQNTAPVAPPPAAFPAQAGGQIAAKTGPPSASETVEATSAAPVTATDAQNLEARQGRDLPAIDRAKALVPSVASPASASGAAVATINQPNQAGGTAFGMSAQSAPGKMLGYVVDPSGAVVSNVRITVTPSNPGGAATAVTDSRGAWLIAGLPTGSYKAQAEAPGFRTTVIDLNYNANQPSLYRFTLDLGNTAETVEVSAENSVVQTDGASFGDPVNGRNLTQLSTVTAGLMPRWAISATGGLQRSLDQGKTWQAVDVNANPARFFNADSSATSLQVADKGSRAQAQKNKDSGKLAKQEAGALTFRAVTAAGSEVWAGGAGGALYHSRDAGNNWARIVPASAGTTLTGDILSIAFPDPQHGKVSTSTSEVWLTADGGQTWQKQ